MRLNDMWRRLAVLTSALVMGGFLVGCGGPSKEDAAELALEITEAMYDNDVDTVIEYLPPPDMIGLDRDQQELMARELFSRRLQSLQRTIEANGGVDSIEVERVEQKGQLFGIFIKVTFENGKVIPELAKLAWSSSDDQFYIAN